eukprot:5778669-Pleurochrysis_carterae.AAC.2
MRVHVYVSYVPLKATCESTSQRAYARMMACICASGSPRTAGHEHARLSFSQLVRPPARPPVQS